MYQTTWAEIDLGALARNIRISQKYLSPSSSICGVVKADGYGHGAVAVARTFLKEGIRFLAVANLREALELRSAGIQGSILVMGWTPPEGFRAAILENISLTFFLDKDFEILEQRAKELGKKAKIHLKMETGMNRLGASWNDAILRLAKEVGKYPSIEIEGVFSHLASSDIKDTEMVMKQFERYNYGISLLRSAGIDPGIRHIDNSAGLYYYPETHLDMVRVGGGAYGMGMDESIGLELVMTLKTRIAYIKEIEEDEPVGYGGVYHSKKPMKVATLPVGYADGWTWALRNFVFQKNGRKLTTIGNICMDQMMIDISEWPDCQVGDELVLCGKEGSSPKEIAAYAGITEFEVPVRLGKRVPRVYIE